MSISFNLGLLSKYRSELMGLACIMVLVGHAEGNNVALYPILKNILSSLASFGVDIFLLLSGIGIYYSLPKQVAIGGVVNH